MRRLHTILLVHAVLIATLVPARCQGKITADPNTPEARKLAAHEITSRLDPRLAQKVTYACGQRRVHEAVADLSRTTGVALYAGKSKLDWKSRDIPIVVGANDLPLGRLLRAITAATHLNLFTERIGKENDPKARTYRLWRDKPRQDAIDNYFAEKEATDKARATWNWDVGSRYKDVPESQLSQYDREDKKRPFALSMSELLSKLGPEARDKVMAGDTIRLNLGNAPASVRGTLLSMFKAEWTAGSEGRPDRALKTPTEDDYKKSELMLYYDGTLMTPIRDPFGGSEALYTISNVSYYMFDYADKFGLPKYINPTIAPPVDDPDLAFKALTKKADYDSPGLQVKFDLEWPKDKRPPTFGDLIPALAEKSGYSIICEDFYSHKTDCNTLGYFTSNTTLGAVLYSLYGDSKYKWYIDELNKIIVGRANEWPDKHRSLVPQELIQRMRAKLDTTGIDIDDYAEMLSLDDRQFFDWIQRNRELDMTSDLSLLAHRKVWKFYHSLSPADKAAVKSEGGLALSKFDSAIVIPVFEGHLNDIRQFLERYPFEQPAPSTDPRYAEAHNVDKFPTDPGALAGMTMRMKLETIWEDPKAGRNVDAPSSTKGLIESREYTLHYEWDSKGEKGHTRGETIFRTLPMYSRKRYAELYPETVKKVLAVP